ncbi:putative ribonuclease H-like domain-containing protein [Tanacetum coccineum]
MEQYLTHIDYALWEVIMNGDAPAIASASTEGPIPLKTAEQKLSRKNELKAKSTLLLAIPDEHLLKFHGIKDAKTLWKAIKAKFQKLISQLEIHGEVISQEDANLKLLRSLPSAWKNIALIMRNKSDLDTLSMNDLYNNLKGQASFSTYANDVMFSFFANQSNSPQLDNEDMEQIDTGDLEEMDLKWRGHFARECREPRNQGNRNGDAPRRNAPVDTSTTNALVVQDGIDLKNQLEEALKEKDDLKLKLEKFEESSKNLTKLINCQISAKDKAGLGYDSQMNESEVVYSVFNSRESDVHNSPVNDRFKIGEGFHAVPPPYTGNYMPSRPDLSFAGLDNSVYKTKVSETETSISKTSKDIVENPKIVRPGAPIIEDWDTDSDNDSVFRPKSDQIKPKFTKINFVKSDENVKSVNKENTHRQVEYLRKSQSPRDNRRNWNGMMTQKLGNGFEFIKKACFVCGSFNHLIKDCGFHENKMVEKPVLNKKERFTGQREIRPVWNNAQRVNHQNKLTLPHSKRNFVPTVVATKSGQVSVNAAKQSSPRAAALISTARPVNTGNPQYTLQDQGIFNSGCSRHMTVNKSFLIDYQEIDGGFELKINLFYVSQMCDKKNSVLFTETECLVLSLEFKLLDESQALLKVPRHNNMYSFDLKNVIPLGGLTCLFAKATIDESNLWHHINFKTMNKFVKGNLVRRLPSKLFENNHTCVACQKGKQRKASCKTKLVSPISQPLHLLHMDLFGPTSVRSIKHKIYCLVVTDDYSRLSWVLFLATKDETSGILKTFITGIENQINHKVKIIRCDNGTEFKNIDMNQFYGMKGIKRDFSVAKTPQKIELLKERIGH